MKKNYIFSFMAASLICGSVMGQGSLIEPTMGGKTPVSIPKKKQSIHPKRSINFTLIMIMGMNTWLQITKDLSGH